MSPRVDFSRNAAAYDCRHGSILPEAAGGRLLHEWGNGQDDEEWVQIRERARDLFEEAGVSSPFHPGARSEREVDEELNLLGFVRSAVLPLGPGQTLTLAGIPASAR